MPVNLKGSNQLIPVSVTKLILDQIVSLLIILFDNRLLRSSWYSLLLSKLLHKTFLPRRLFVAIRNSVHTFRITFFIIRDNSDISCRLRNLHDHSFLLLHESILRDVTVLDLHGLFLILYLDSRQLLP